MPIYEYQCKKCKDCVEVLQKADDEPREKCEKCGGVLVKLVTNTFCGPYLVTAPRMFRDK